MSDTNINNIPEPEPEYVSPHTELFDFLASTIVNLYMQVEPIVSSESWGTWDQRDKETFRATMASLSKVNTAIRNGFDSAIWSKRITGVEPVRAQSSRGKDTAVKSTADKLKELLNK